jgi:hypothetical protein
MNQSLRLDIAEDKRESLKLEFDQLETIDQKYDFWSEKLERNYFLWALYEQDNIKDFLIFPKNASETEMLNKRIYSDYCLVVSENKTLINWKKSFIDQIEKATDKEILIEYELNNIDNIIFKRKQVSISDNMHQYEKNRYFIGGYEDYLLWKKEIDWKEGVYQAHLLLEKNQGVEWAKYREFVKTYLKQEKTRPEIKLTGEQKVLALIYLGFGNQTTTAVQKADLFEYFIDNFKSKSIQKIFNSTTDYEDEKNLDALIDFFRSLKMKSIARDLEDKIENLKQKPIRK